MSSVVIHAMDKEALYLPSSVSSLCTGIGPVNTVLSLVKEIDYLQNFRNIINVGFVGSDTLPVGTVCVVDTAVYRDYDVDIYNEKFEYILSQLPKRLAVNFKKVTCFTGYSFYTGGDFKKSGSIDPSLPKVFDMELAALCQFVQRFFSYKRVISIKLVSDTCNVEQYEAFDYNKARYQLTQAVKDVLTELELTS